MLKMYCLITFSKLNYVIKTSKNRRFVINGQKFDSSKFEKVLRV